MTRKNVVDWAARRHEREPWRYAVRLLVSLALFIAALFWLFMAFLLNGFRCDDVCSGSQGSWWGYPAQLVLAAVGFVLTLVALPLGFSDKFFPYRAVLAGAIVCAGIWYFWVFELSGFYAAGGF